MEKKKNMILEADLISRQNKARNRLKALRQMIKLERKNIRALKLDLEIEKKMYFDTLDSKELPGCSDERTPYQKED